MSGQPGYQQPRVSISRRQSGAQAPLNCRYLTEAGKGGHCTRQNHRNALVFGDLVMSIFRRIDVLPNRTSNKSGLRNWQKSSKSQAQHDTKCEAKVNTSSEKVRKLGRRWKCDRLR